MTPMMMTYKRAKASGGAADIVMMGEFTGLGVLGPQFVGKTIPMRSVIELESADRATTAIYFAPPGRPSGSGDPDAEVDDVIACRAPAFGIRRCGCAP
ncbi:hypothetical protein [Nocardia sp. NPDC005998]|uniref:hypothetical protein n=1 Tax=Nocardia sp. NPDC005998 TaxID=3156894 RepID=UPI0033AC20C8